MNVVWICMDQYPLANRGDIAATMPLHARMIREGTSFSRAYTVLPICTPARASMLTGLYPHMHGITGNDGRFGGRPGLTRDDWVVSLPFQNAGYETAWFGKWHLDNASGAEAFGFQGFSLPGYGYPYGSAEYRDYLDRHHLPRPIATVEIPGESGLAVGSRLDLAQLDDWPDFEAGAMSLEGPAELHEAFFVADLACDWIERQTERPMFLRIDTWGPHPPYCVAPPFTGSLDGQPDRRPQNFWSDLSHRPAHHRSYRDEWQNLGLDDAGWRLLHQRSLEQTALVEAALCRVLDTLDRLQIRERTLVIVTADHGDAVGSNGGTANKGGLLTEETVRIPLLMSGPGIAPRGVSEDLVTNLDLAPTALGMAGLKRPGGLQGARMFSDPVDPGLIDRKGVLLQHYGLHDPLFQRAWISGDWKLVIQEDGFAELYDLKEDPHELNNLAGCSKHLSQMAAMVDGMAAEMSRLNDVGERQQRMLHNVR